VVEFIARVESELSNWMYHFWKHRV